jgi:hypothetical protein
MTTLRLDELEQTQSTEVALQSSQKHNEDTGTICQAYRSHQQCNITLTRQYDLAASGNWDLQLFLHPLQGCQRKKAAQCMQRNSAPNFFSQNAPRAWILQASIHYYMQRLW